MCSDCGRRRETSAGCDRATPGERGRVWRAPLGAVQLQFRVVEEVIDLLESMTDESPVPLAIDPRPGSLLIGHGNGDRRREVGIDRLEV